MTSGLFIPQEHGPAVRIPHDLETSHVMLQGDTGGGKSSLLRHFLMQIAERRHVAVVFDPAREFLRDFYDESRGDVILNPLDARSPYWTPSRELRFPAEAITVAASLFTRKERENPFFTEAPKKIFAHLLTMGLSMADIVQLLEHDRALDVALRGTRYAAYIDPGSPTMRGGIMAELSLAADALAFLPTSGPVTWSATDWAETRQGWIFVTSTPNTRERLVPLHTMWLDLLILRLMHASHPQRVFFVMDELSTLGRLPQLATGLAELRKANVSMLIAFQAKAQLDKIYRDETDAMLSQPATKIGLRTSEPKSAKWFSDVIGEVERQRVRESRTFGGKGHPRTDAIETKVEPLLLPSQIEGLPNRTGYIKCGNVVTKIQFPFKTLPHTVPDFIERQSAVPQALPQPMTLTDSHADVIIAGNPC